MKSALIALVVTLLTCAATSIASPLPAPVLPSRAASAKHVQKMQAQINTLKAEVNRLYKCFKYTVPVITSTGDDGTVYVVQDPVDDNSTTYLVTMNKECM